MNCEHAHIQISVYYRNCNEFEVNFNIDTIFCPSKTKNERSNESRKFIFLKRTLI